MPELTELQLLTIPLDMPEKLFSGTEAEITLQYRRLSNAWHPDKNPTASPAVFARISLLRTRAIEMLQNGTWPGPSTIEFKSLDGSLSIKLPYLRSHPFELGQQYIGRDMLVYSVEESAADLVEHASRITMTPIRYANHAMQREHERYLPKIKAPNKFRVIGGKVIAEVAKPPGTVLLRDLQTHMGRIPPAHVAWIVSRLLGLNCFLDFVGIVHGAINIDTVFVDPAMHTCHLYGGWWYAQHSGQRLRAAHPDTVKQLPKLRAAPIAKRNTDSALIRSLARTLLGGPAGTPDAMWRWALGQGRETPYAEMSDWQNKILTASFGARRFVRLDVSPSDIYKSR